MRDQNAGDLCGGCGKMEMEMVWRYAAEPDQGDRARVGPIEAGEAGNNIRSTVMQFLRRGCRVQMM